MNANFVNIEDIKTLEDYLIHLGMLGIGVRTLQETNTHAIKIGILNDDEIENAKTIIHEINRLFTTLDDQVKLVLSRTDKDSNNLNTRIKEILGKKPRSKPRKKT
jgi:hypothetical protein